MGGKVLVARDAPFAVRTPPGCSQAEEVWCFPRRPFIYAAWVGENCLCARTHYEDMLTHGQEGVEGQFLPFLGPTGDEHPVDGCWLIVDGGVEVQNELGSQHLSVGGHLMTLRCRLNRSG